jgi:hypothetical protein
MAIGLDPHRPTAKTAPLRPPTQRTADGFTIVSTALLLIVILGTLALLSLAVRRAAPDELNSPVAWTEQLVAAWLPAQQPTTTALVQEFDQLGSSFGRDEQVGAWIVEPVPDEGVYRMLIWPGHLAWHVMEGQPITRTATQLRIDTEAAHGYAGLVAGYRDGRNFYLLAVDGGGNYRVQRQHDGAWSDVQPWTASAQVAPAGTANQLAVETVDGGLRFSANGTLLYELRATEAITGATGIAAGAAVGGDAEPAPGMLKVDFDWYEAETPAIRGEAPAQ